MLGVLNPLFTIFHNPVHILWILREVFLRERVLFVVLQVSLWKRQVNTIVDEVSFMADLHHAYFHVKREGWSALIKTEDRFHFWRREKKESVYTSWILYCIIPILCQHASETFFYHEVFTLIIYTLEELGLGLISWTCLSWKLETWLFTTRTHDFGIGLDLGHFCGDFTVFEIILFEPLLYNLLYFLWFHILKKKTSTAFHHHTRSPSPSISPRPSELLCAGGFKLGWNHRGNNAVCWLCRIAGVYGRVYNRDFRRCTIHGEVLVWCELHIADDTLVVKVLGVFKFLLVFIRLFCRLDIIQGHGPVKLELLHRVKLLCLFRVSNILRLHHHNVVLNAL